MLSRKLMKLSTLEKLTTNVSTTTKFNLKLLLALKTIEDPDVKR